MAEAYDYIYTVCTFLGFLMVVIPLPWHLQAWNASTCLFMFWTSLCCLNYSINSIVWRNDYVNRAPVWCDISSRITVAAAVGIPVTSMCIHRRLYHIASVKTVRITSDQKKRAVIVDLAIGLGIPLLEVCLYTIVQNSRFVVYERVGCLPTVYVTPASVVLTWIWPIVIGAISCVYCGLAIRSFAKRRAQFKELLACHSNLNSNRYFRLMALAAVGFSFTIPLSSYFLSTNVSPGLQSWKELAPTRARYSFVALIPFEVWGSDRAVFEISRWAPVLCAVLFFVFFGFTQDAKEHYHLAYSSLAKRLGSASARFKSGGGVTLALDTRVPHEVKLEGGITDPGYGRPKSPASTTASSLVYEIP